MRITHTCVSSLVVSEDVSSRVVPEDAIRVPSGDHTGSYSALLVLVSRSTMPSRELTVKMS